MALGDYTPQRRTTPNTQTGSNIANFWIVLPKAEYATVQTDFPEHPLSDRVHYAIRYAPEAKAWEKMRPNATHRLLSCYIRHEGLHDITAIREELQDFEDFFSDSIKCVGCWDFYTGEPIGGVGSPWFVTPHWVDSDFPILRGTAPELGGVTPTAPITNDGILFSGQAPRKFV